MSLNKQSSLDINICDERIEQHQPTATNGYRWVQSTPRYIQNISKTIQYKLLAKLKSRFSQL